MINRQNTSARIATPSSRNSARFVAPTICRSALGCRAMPSAVPAASLPMPRPAPTTASPKPIPAPAYALATPITGLLLCSVRSVIRVDGHADEHGREQCKDVSLHEHDDDFNTGDADRQGHQKGDPN